MLEKILCDNKYFKHDKNISSVTDMFTHEPRTANFTIESEGVMMLEITLTDETNSLSKTNGFSKTN